MTSTKLNVDTFITVLKKSGLVDRDRLEAALNDYSESSGGSEDPLPLVERLIASNILTKWQAEKLLQGKHRGYFLGKYKLLSLLGKGGMSSVYLAEHLLMRRRCALKVLPAKRVDDSSYLERFHREAQAVALLDHPNIVRAYDVDHQADGERQIHFLVMEHVDGLSLQEMVASNGVIPFLDAAEYTRQAAAGLQNAHEHGMVHRDIKPGNVLVDQSGVVKILDLGLARFFTAEEGDDALTIRHDEKVLGTADYLAPEQALDSHTVDSRADIYSLGCTLYFMLTGQPPFTEGTLAQRLMAHQVKTPPPVESLRVDTPPGLIVILRKMMEKQASDRFATAGDLEKALFKWINENAEPEWRNAHSGVYGSRVLHSDSVRKAIPVAQPIAAKGLNPVSSEAPKQDFVAPISSKVNSAQTPPDGMDIRDTETNQFFSTLTQSDAKIKNSKTPPDSSPKQSSKSSPKVRPIEAPELVVMPPPAAPGPSTFPVFEPHEFDRPPTTKITETTKTVASATLAPRASISERLNTLLTAWIKLPSATRNGIAVGASIVLLLGLYTVFGSGRSEHAINPKQSAGAPFPKHKRDVTVGGAKAEYSTIRDALVAVRNRFRPGIGNEEKFVVRIAAGTYKEPIKIDGRAAQWPEGVVLLGDGDVILESTTDGPVIRLSNVSRLTIENIQVNATEKLVAIEVTDDLHETRLNKLTVRGFSSVGVLCKGAQGLSFGNNQFVLDQLTFEATSPQAIGVQLQEGPDNDVSSIVIKSCRFLGSMDAGIVLQSRDLFGLRVSESVFNRLTDGIRIDGQPTLKAVHISNNSFRNCKNGIRFFKLPTEQSSDLVIRRNLFTKVEVAEVVVRDDYDENRFRSIFSTAPPGIENNWSDRSKPAAPAKGEAQPIFDNGGRSGEQNFAFASTDPKESKFLAPTGTSPQKDVGGAQPNEKNWVGAIGP